MRRLTFVHTTLDRLYDAGDVRDLFYQEDPFEVLWHALRSHRLRPLKNRIIGDRPVDITLRAQGGYLGIQCREAGKTHEAPQLSLPDRWQLMHVPPIDIERDLGQCLRRIASGLIALGGSDLRQP